MDNILTISGLPQICCCFGSTSLLHFILVQPSDYDSMSWIQVKWFCVWAYCICVCVFVCLDSAVLPFSGTVIVCLPGCLATKGS